MRVNIIFMLIGMILFCLSFTLLQHIVSLGVILYNMRSIERKWDN